MHRDVALGHDRPPAARPGAVDGVPGTPGGRRGDRPMTAPPVADPGTAPGPGGMPAGPVARRVRPPRWLDLRLAPGVLLVLGSVLVGARVVSAADATVPVWSATGDLAAGTVLSADDLAAVPGRLGARAPAHPWPPAGGRRDACSAAPCGPVSCCRARCWRTRPTWCSSPCRCRPATP